MNLYRWIMIICILGMTLTACSPAATPIAVEPRREVARTAVVEKEGVIEKVVEQPRRPQSTSAPEWQPAAPQRNQFEDPGVNPPENTDYDNLSTFALDVDTAAYTVARRYILDGSLPPYDAIRVEEFVNYFDGGYEIPEGAAFAIYADGAPAPYDRNELLLRIGIQGYRIDAEERKPASLVFIIDTSGSMADDQRLEMVKDSLKLLVEQLTSQDQVSIVTFNTTARIHLDTTRGDRKSTIIREIEKLTPAGSTNAEGGLRIGYKLAMQDFIPEGTNRVIFCSDGVANTGEIDQAELLDMVYGAVSEGVTLTTIGVGMGNFNDAFLEQLADKGNGNYHYIDDMDQAEKIFVDNLEGTLDVIALDTKVQVDFNSEVVAEYRLLGYENRAIADEDFRNDEVDAGELGAGHSATALYAVRLVEGAEGRMATVQLRWKDPDTHEAIEINGNVNTWDMGDSFKSANPRYQLAVSAGLFAEYLRQSPWASYYGLDELAHLSNIAANNLPWDQDAEELADIIGKAERICQRTRCP